ncbi:MAG TPA: hydroxyacylglutathione hydrolase [Polyangiaceae bacterium]|nr:hydroxyacylglutathione hydrolase [Polyangiaceae bacterium]
MTLGVTPIPCLEDNYAYLLDDGSGELAVVDASESAPVEAALAGAEGRLTAVFATHHHQDHVGGNEALAARHEGLRIYGYESDRGRIPNQSEFLTDGQAFTWSRLHIRALHIPGHTTGAVAYVIGDVVFTGDTLFLAGCGRLFEGTPAMMYRSLNEVLARLDPGTRIYCGHEYTVSNLKFAMHVEPGNGAARERLARTTGLRARGEPTVGGTIAEELATNPFLRCGNAEIRRTIGAPASASDVEVFALLRRAKDVFRPPA